MSCRENVLLCRVLGEAASHIADEMRVVGSGWDGRSGSNVYVNRISKWSSIPCPHCEVDHTSVVLGHYERDPPSLQQLSRFRQAH